MTPKLTDFSFDELNWLYLVLQGKLDECNNKIDIISKFDPSITKYDLFEHWTKQHDICTQWMTKVDEAQKILRARDILLTDN